MAFLQQIINGLSLGAIYALIALGYTGNQWLLLIVTVMTFILAWVSTKTVGSLSMRMKLMSQQD